MDERAKSLSQYFLQNNDSLSKTEKIVHDHFMTFPEQVIYATTKQLSKTIDVSEAAITRYIKKIEYENFQVFKLELLKKLEEFEIMNNEPYIEQLTHNMINAINETKNKLSTEELDKASDYLANAKKILIVGMGTSNITARDAFSKLTRVGIDAVVITDSHLLYSYSATLDKDTALLCYSFSGETYEVVKTAELAKQNGCKVVGITNYEDSAISKIADATLFTRGYEQNIKGGSFSAKVSQLYLTDILITKLALLNEKKSKENINKVVQAFFNIGD